VNIYPLIFSNKSSYRISRHVFFWCIWITYYAAITAYGLGQRLPLWNRFSYSLSEILLTTPLDMIFCYAIIYFLLPKFLFKGRYMSMLLLWLLFSIVFIIAFEVYTNHLIPALRSSFNLPFPKGPSDYFWLSFSLFSQINMEGCIAASVKLGKITFIKQREIDLLRNEKAKLQPLRDKTDLQPVFLADFIKRVESMVAEKSVHIPGVLQKIRNMMTNIMYENTDGKISIKREIELVNQYIELEQCTAVETIDVELNTSDILESESIASFILLQFIQNGFNQLSQFNIIHKTMEIDIKIANSILTASICWNKPVYTSTLLEGKNIILLNLNKRLKLLYPGSHEIKVIIDVEKIKTCLKIDLKGAIN
jgi:hypothetical protein